ncbi:MAG: hypothetical protein PHW04_07135, partial [Candidatus Wallbacteria bacterium]|nr:hypothetical protein [Candidatus Wallbacteria bacterium]
GERWWVDLFDFTLDRSDLCLSGLKLLVHDNSYTGEAYVGYRNQQLNALGPEINTCGLIFHSGTGPRRFLCRVSTYSDQSKPYFRRNNTDIDEMSMDYDYSGDQFSQASSLSFTRSRKFLAPPAFNLIQNSEKAAALFQSQMSWNREIWWSDLNLRFANEEYQRPSGEDYRDDSGGEFNYSHLVGRDLTLHGGVKLLAHPQATDDEFTYLAGLESNATFLKYQGYWMAEFQRERINGENYTRDGNNISARLRLTAHNNQYQLDLRCKDRDSDPDPLCSVFFKEADLSNIHYFSPVVWIESRLGGESDDRYFKYKTGSSTQYLNRNTRYCLNLDYSEKRSLDEATNFSHQNLTDTITIIKSLNVNENISFDFSEVNEDYSEEILNNHELKVGIRYTRLF